MGKLQRLVTGIVSLREMAVALLQILGRFALSFTFISATEAQTATTPKPPVNAYWAAGAAAKYEDGKQPLAPILLSFAARWSAGYDKVSPEEVIEKTRQLKRQMEDRNLPQKAEDLAALWDAAGAGLVGYGIRRSYRSHLQDSAEAVWGGMTGSAKELAHQPGFWEEIDELAAKDPARTGKVVSTLAMEYLGIDRSMSKAQIIARVPQLAADERIALILQRASEGSLTAAQARDAVAQIGPELGAKLDRIKEQLAEKNTRVKTIGDWVQDQRRSEARQRKIDAIRDEYAGYRAGVRILSTALHMANVDAGVQRTVEASAILIGLSEQFALYAATGGSALVLSASSISAFANLSGLIGQAPDDPTLVMLRGLDQRMVSLQNEMRASFGVVHQQLDAVIDLAFRSYREVVIAAASVEATRVVLASLQQDLWAAEDRITADIRDLGELETTRLRTSCVVAKGAEATITTDFFRQCLFLLFSDATQYSLSRLVSDDEGFTTVRATRVLSRGTARGFRYLVRARQSEFPAVSTLFVNPSEVPNPVVWAAGANDYLQFVDDWSELYRKREDNQQQLEAMRQVGRKVRLALDEIGGVVRVDDQTSRRDSRALIGTLEQYYSDKLKRFSKEFDDAVAKSLTYQTSSRLFDDPKGVSIDAIPNSFPLCSDFTWQYKSGDGAPFDPGPSKGLAHQIPASVSDEVRASTPKWLRGQGGMTPGGSRRIATVSVCLQTIVEMTDRRTCRGGTFSGGTMPRAVAIAKVDVKLLRPTGRLEPYSATPDATAYETISFQSTVEYPQEGPCTKGPGLGWNARLATTLPAFIANARNASSGQSLEMAVKEKVSAVYIGEKKPAIDVWLQAAQEAEKAGTGLNEAIADLDGARSLIGAYVSVAFPTEFVNGDFSLLLAGDLDVRLPDRDVFTRGLYCLVNEKAENCGAPTTQASTNDILKDGWTAALQRRSSQTFTYLRDATQANIGPQRYALVDLTLARIEAALLRVRPKTGRPPAP